MAASCRWWWPEMEGQKIVPHLWFDDAAEEAARLYAGLIPGSAVGEIRRFGKASAGVHGQPEGKVMTVEFTLGGTRMVALNGGPHFPPSAAISYFLTFEDADALDRAWAALLDGGEVAMPLDAYDWSLRYGWVTDRWDVNWQLSLGRLADVGGQPVVPFLLFTGAVAGEAEAAIAHYMAVFPETRLEGVLRHDGSGAERAGSVKHAQFRLCGQTFMAMDSALDHPFAFTEGNSFLVLCDDQAEIDRYWAALSAVPEAERCGWLKDRFGISWQIVPRILPELMRDPAAAERVTAAFIGMGKIDIAALERARDG
jgi:predicted 3-demethylubiquinone-9 3-methyltransferase (glyoxalase superfamily)